MKRFIFILSSSLLAASCVELLDTAFDVQQPITTDYPVEKRVFYDEFLAQGEIYGGIVFSELGFYLSDTEYGDDNAGVRKFVADQFENEFFRAWIGGLEPGTAYYLKAYGIGNDGTEYCGRTVRVTTSSEIIDYVSVEALPENAVSVNARHYRLSGKVSDFGGDEDGVIEYGVYSRIAGSGEGYAKTSVIPGSDNPVALDTPFDVLVTDLVPKTEYEYRIYARNNRKEQLSETFTFVTEGTTMPSVVYKGTENIATTLFSVAGTVTDYGNDPDVECGFYFGEQADNLSERLVSEEFDEENNFIVRKRGLEKETAYFLKPFVKNYSGEAVGETVSVLTGPESVPQLTVHSPDYGEILTTVTENSVSLRAFLNSDGGLNIDHCGVYWGKSADNLTEKTEGEIVGQFSDTVEVNINGLGSGDVVYYEFYAENAKGEYRAPMESIAAKIVIPAWENAGANMNAGAPNNWIQRSASATETYYELPPVTVTEADGKKYKYYFLDRNLGATQVVESPAVSNNINMIGSSYVFSYPKPGSVPSTGVVAQTKFGWVNDNPLHSDCLDWNMPEYTPAPEHYSIPTRAEWTALMESMPESERNLTGIFNLIKVGKTGNRPKNGGVFQKTIQYATLYCADKDDVAGASSVFQARDPDSDADFSGEPYMVVADATNKLYIGNNVAENGGACVRCFRKMPVDE